TTREPRCAELFKLLGFPELGGEAAMIRVDRPYSRAGIFSTRSYPDVPRCAHMLRIAQPFGLGIGQSVKRCLHGAPHPPDEVALDPLIVNRDDIVQRTRCIV